ncbi:MAG: AraC family transcriptional regulator [Campylobacterales bacterium]|nr:AraC family transcriptional regulator [Campylobacterales bacterium]
MFKKLTREEIVSQCNIIRSDNSDGYVKEELREDNEFFSGMMVRSKVGEGMNLLLSEITPKKDLEISGVSEGEVLKFTAVLDGKFVKKDFISEEEIEFSENEISVEYLKKEVSSVFVKKGKLLRYIHITFSQKYLEKNDYLFSELNYRKDRSCYTKFYNPVIQTQFKDLFDYSYGDDLERMFLRNKTVALMFFILKHFKQKKLIYPDYSEDDIARLEKARLILKDSISQKMTISLLSKKVALNEFKLKKGFKEVYNQTIYSYLQELRFEKAIELIKEEEYSIGKVAEMVGYKNQSSFSSAFMKKYGFLPKNIGKQKIVLN